MIALNDIRKSSIVILRTNFGQGIAVRAIVDEVEEDVKNGQPGLCYTICNAAAWDDGGWAYLTQVDRVVKY